MDYEWITMSRNALANSLEKLLKIVAYLELLSSLVSTFVAIFALVYTTSAITEAKKDKMDTNPLFKYAGIIAIKLFYLVILFLLVEVCLTLFLLRAVKRKNLAHLKLWLVIGGIYTVLYMTDFISTLHAMSTLEDVPVSLGIFLKALLMFLVWKYIGQLEQNYGDNLTNNDEENADC